MSMLVKICGLSTPESVVAARDGGASHLGFIFFPKSPRNVSVEQARDLISNAGDCDTVAVTVNADDDILNNIVTIMKPSMLQLHGNESPERVAQVKAKFGLPVIKAMAVRSGDDLAKAQSYGAVADMLLLDAKPPVDSDLPGGNGVSFDWSLVEKIRSSIPIMLSGGIGLENIDKAVELARDNANDLIGLDLSSGVESSPGVKDLNKIAMLLAATAGE